MPNVLGDFIVDIVTKQSDVNVALFQETLKSLNLKMGGGSRRQEKSSKDIHLYIEENFFVVDKEIH